MAAVDPLKLALAVSGALILCLCLLVLCRIWRRNRYYKKVQVSLDEEERAFQETLARSYNDEAAIDENDQQKLQMLETYMNMQGGSPGGRGGDLEEGGEGDYSIPTKPEDVDKFMKDLAAAAAGDAGLEPADEDGSSPG